MKCLRLPSDPTYLFSTPYHLHFSALTVINELHITKKYHWLYHSHPRTLHEALRRPHLQALSWLSPKSHRRRLAVKPHHYTHATIFQLNYFHLQDSSSFNQHILCIFLQHAPWSLYGSGHLLQPKKRLYKDFLSDFFLILNFCNCREIDQWMSSMRWCISERHNRSNMTNILKIVLGLRLKQGGTEDILQILTTVGHSSVHSVVSRN